MSSVIGPARLPSQPRPLAVRSAQNHMRARNWSPKWLVPSSAPRSASCRPCATPTTSVPGWKCCARTIAPSCAPRARHQGRRFPARLSAARDRFRRCDGQRGGRVMHPHDRIASAVQSVAARQRVRGAPAFVTGWRSRESLSAARRGESDMATPFRRSPQSPRATFPSTSWCSASPTSAA